MTSTVRLQHEADAARAGLSTALDDLRGSVTTTALTNGAMTFAKEGSSAVARAAIDRAIASPLAAMMIAAGVFMLMANNKNTAAGGAVEKGNETVRHAATAIGSMGSKIATAAADGYAATRGAAGSVLDTAKDAAGKVSSTASQATDAASDAYDKAKETVAKGREQGQQALDHAQQLVADTQSRLESFAREQPVLVAALGLAFGAALGASLPITEAERKYMGAAGKAATDRGTDMAKKVAESVTGTLAGSDVGAKVGELADAVSSTVAQSLSKSS